MEYEKLSSLLEMLCRGSRLHICICDISGILRQEPLRLDFFNQVHATAFCDLAKSTKRGYRLCMKCKERANRKAVQEQKAFSGYCPCGLFEAVYPVTVDGAVRCVVYAGNLVPDEASAERRLRRTCRRTGAPVQRLMDELGHGERQVSAEEAMQIARLAGSYIRLLYQKEEPVPAGSPHHWVVETLIEYIRKHYAFPITLRDMASLYYLNEKYIGRLFKAQTGRTFHQYLTEIRLSQAGKLLLETSRNIPEIAQDCGFESAPYFNRLFKQRYQLSPTAYRKKETVRLRIMAGQSE